MSNPIECLETRLLLASTGDITTVAYNGKQVEAFAGEWIVRLDETPGRATGERRSSEKPILPWLDQALDAVRHLGIEFDQYIGRDYRFAIRAPVQLTHATLQTVLSVLPGFDYVQPNLVYYGGAAPNDPSYGNQYYLENTGQEYKSGVTGTADADVDVEDAWAYSKGSYSTVVAVIDSGMNYEHEDLAVSRWRNPIEIGGNSIDDDGNGWVDDYYGYDFWNVDRIPMDDHGHGTFIGGIIGAQGDNGVGISGAMQAAKVLPVKALNAQNSGSSTSIGNSFDYVNATYDAGANIQVINASFGGGTFDSTIFKLIGEAADRNILVVAGAHNRFLNNLSGGVDLDSSTYDVYPAEYDLDNIIVVAATTDDDNLASFSNFGDQTVDVAAPGVDIHSTGVEGGGTQSNNTYSYSDGTSFATPIVAGIAGMIFAMKPNYGYAQLRTEIIDSANSDANLTLSGTVAAGGRINAGRVVASLAPGQDATAWGDFGGMRQNDQFVIRPKPGDSSKTQVRWLNTETSTWETYLEMDNSSSKLLHVYLLAGDDDLKVEAGVQTQIYVAGGRGDDVLNASGDVNITGGISGTDDPELYHAQTPEDPPPPDPANYPVHFVGELGEDTLYGGAANDTLYGNEGADLIRGLAGADYAHAGTENDTVYGGTGNDTLQGAGHNDTINGDAGNDSITGDNSSDYIHGGTNNDSLDAGDGDDTVYGAGHDDTILGGLGSDSLFGDTGNDWIYARNSDLDWVNGGSGTDRGEKDATENLWSSIEILL